MNLAKSALFLFISRAGKTIIGFSAVVVFSREFGSSPMGIYYSFVALLGMLGIVSDFGISRAAEKRISESGEIDKYFTSALMLKILLLLVVSCGILLHGNYINQYMGENLLFIFILTLVLDQVRELMIATLRGELRVSETAPIELITPLSWLLFGYLLHTLGYGPRSIVYSYLVGILFTLLFSLWRISVGISLPRRKHFFSLIEFGKYSIVNSIGGYIFAWIDIFILTIFIVETGAITRGDIGAYENAWRLSLVALVASRSIGSTIFPQFSQWDKNDMRDRIEDLIPSAATPGLLISIPAFVGITVISKDLLRLLFGSEFAVAWLVLIIFSAGKIVQSVHGIIARPLNAIDRPDLSAYATVASVIMNVILNIIMIPMFGIIGAAIATSISASLNTTLTAYWLNKFLDINIPINITSWGLISSVIMGVCVYTMKFILGIDTILDLLLIVGVGIVIYTMMLSLNKEVRINVQQIYTVLIS